MAPYSLPQTIAAFHSFYAFLTTLPSDITPATIVSAPGDVNGPGWPTLTPSYLSPLHKTPAVITLLQHLPYIQGTGSTQIGPETNAIDFTGSATRWSLQHPSGNKVAGTLEPIGAGVIPEWVVSLSSGTRYGSWLLLDTQEGTLTDYIQQERPERDTPPMDSDDFWRAYHTAPIEQFLEEWKEKYRSLEWVVVPENEDDGVMYRWDEATDEVREIYRGFGWPDHFRREDCRQALLEWQQRQRQVTEIS